MPSACTARARRHCRARRADGPRLTVIEGTLGKAFGVMGGYIAGSRRHFAISSGRLHPASSSRRRCRRHWRPAPLASIRHLKVSQFERARHQDRVRRLRAQLDRSGIPCTCRNTEPWCRFWSAMPPSASGSRIPVARLRCLRPADQLSDRAEEGPNVPAHHADAAAFPMPIPTSISVGALHALWSRCALARAVA